MVAEKSGRKLSAKFAFPSDKLERLLVIKKTIGEMLENYLREENYKIAISEIGKMKVYSVECSDVDIEQLKACVAEITELIKEERTCFEAGKNATFIRPKCHNQSYPRI